MFQYVTEAGLELAKLPIDIEEQPGLTMSQITTRARRYKRRHGRLDILAIDHLDLIKPSGRYLGNKVYELGEITAAAKALAKELKCCVVLLSQLSRDVEKREDKRPILADLRSSGRSSRTPTRSFSCTGRNITSPTRSRRRPRRSTSNGKKRCRSRTTSCSRSSPSSAWVRPDRSNFLRHRH
jgi:hypothetical protein